MVNVEKSIRLKKELDSLRPLKKEDEMRIMQKFRLDWNYHSNHLEGNTLTYGETKALILFGITAQGKPLKDHFEVVGHDKAVKWVTEIVQQDRPITENFIRELHKLILKESYEVDAITPDGQPTKRRISVGAYKTTPNHVVTKTGETFRFATPEETPAKMHDLIAWHRKKLENAVTNPILLAAKFHYKYISIHPFDDGNGRTARILMNVILMQLGYPPVIIKTEDKENYFAALRQADAGVLEPFVEYIAKNLNRSLEIMIKGAKGESIEEPDDIEKEIALLEQKLKGVGQSVEVSKTKKIILEIYDDSVVRLAKEFIKKGELFEKFYIKNQFSIITNGAIKSIEKGDDVIKILREIITDGTDSIRLQFYHEAFNRTGFEAFKHSSIITFQFDYTKYKVRNTNGVTFEKLYGEQLSEEEVNKLVNSEIKKHTKLIAEKIEELKNKK